MRKNKLLLFGILSTLIGGAGWFLCVILSALTLGAFRVAANLFGLLALVGIVLMSLGIILKLIRKFRK